MSLFRHLPEHPRASDYPDDKHGLAQWRQACIAHAKVCARFEQRVGLEIACVVFALIAFVSIVMWMPA